MVDYARRLSETHARQIHSCLRVRRAESVTALTTTPRLMGDHIGNPAVANLMSVPSGPTCSYPVSAAGHAEIRTITFASYY